MNKHFDSVEVFSFFLEPQIGRKKQVVGCVEVGATVSW
jgi:hypothetical protein